jgi:hypothetical protein
MLTADFQAMVHGCRDACLVAAETSLDAARRGFVHGENPLVAGGGRPTANDADVVVFLFGD